MESILLIALIALAASMLTFFSGFGLGTILLPAFGIFFPIETAIAATGVIHLGNNLFKLGLVGKNIDFKILLRFGIPSIVGAFAGALLLHEISHWAPLGQYTLGENVYTIHPLKIGIALLMILFSLFELIPRLKKIQTSRGMLIPGGVISGFFGGLSGHQGALRSVFLVKIIQKKEVYIATGTAIACLVDFTRIPVYWGNVQSDQLLERPLIIVIPMIAAFLGAVIGNRLLKKITLHLVQNIVALGIIIFALAMGAGIL